MSMRLWEPGGGSFPRAHVATKRRPGTNRHPYFYCGTQSGAFSCILAPAAAVGLHAQALD